jgi:integrase
LKGLFKWALNTSKLPPDHRNPMLHIEEPPKGKARERVLTDEEIRTIWKTCEAWEREVLADDEVQRRTGKRPGSGAPSIADFSRVIRLLFLTGCRKAEITDLRWDELDLDNGEIFIKAHRIKTDRNLCNPLPSMAVEILRGIEKRPGEPFVFGTVPGKGLSVANIHHKLDRRIARAGRRANDALSPERELQIRDMIAAGVGARAIIHQVHTTSTTVAKVRKRMAAGAPIMPTASKPEPWAVHDIRRTFRTRLSECGVNEDIAERLVNHVGHQSQMNRVYNRHDFWTEKRIALAKWQDKLCAILDGTAREGRFPAVRKEISIMTAMTFDEIKPDTVLTFKQWCDLIGVGGDQDRVISIAEWSRLAGISEKVAREVQLSLKRIGVRVCDHRAWLAARTRKKVAMA